MSNRKFLLLAVLLAGCAPTSEPSAAGDARSDLRITFLDVGQGDCSVVQTGGRTILIDAGPAKSGEKVVVRRLRALGVASVDMILLSHPDADHTGGVKAVLEAFPATKVVFSTEFQAHPDVVKDGFRWHQTPITIDGKTPMNVGNVRFDFLCPPWGPGGQDNDGSMFVRVSDGMASATFSGDAPSAIEEWALDQGFDPASDVLHCGHHGSRFSSGLKWLRASGARYGVLSCGRNNRYGHPHPDVLDRLAQTEIKPWRIDEAGEVTFVVRDGHLTPE
jgi:competence protein ComEC